MFKTKKEARASGYICQKDIDRQGLVPKDNAKAVDVKGETFFALRDMLELITKTEGNRRGLKLKPDAIPTSSYKVNTGLTYKYYDVYRMEDFVPKRKSPRLVQPKKIEVLNAIWTVNRAAKRYRDAAQNFYQHKMHGFSQNSKSTKENLYELKAKGLRVAIARGLVQCVGIHDDLACYSGGGYFFHSPQILEGDYPKNTSSLRVEAKPKTSSEGRLKDAIFTLESLEDVVVPGLAVRPRTDLRFASKFIKT